ncbi:MAG: hypothetical protein ACP5QG_02285 [candidate division WOR-3 bacterium]
MREFMMGAVVLALAGCGGTKQTQSTGGQTVPKLTPVIEGAAWVNKMPGFVEKDSIGQPIYPGRFLLKVYGEAEIIKILIKTKSRDIGEFTAENLLKKNAERWTEYLVQRELRITEADTLSVRVWMIVGEDTIESFLPAVPVKAVY